ncbi:hypothetical protein [Kitasatospora sp. DSM 101779]|uniref:hypothetical protein n=1 Tax=Kitasatospora sp. DSM 101779 TaxID=2853165 RepID=UPI0021D9B944|nr:hypothetical protein [Kitasatospora sp. DSM 101779]MCU7820154.1 hypothetical protein [Kitasatospora sp. DSM 101779]
MSVLETEAAAGAAIEAATTARMRVTKRAGRRERIRKAALQHYSEVELAAFGDDPLDAWGKDVRKKLYCGLYSLRPTYGIVPNRGHVPRPPGWLTTSDMLCIGPLGRSAADSISRSVSWPVQRPTRPRRGSCRCHHPCTRR